jgi:hypothetical protein
VCHARGQLHGRSMGRGHLMGEHPPKIVLRTDRIGDVQPGPQNLCLFGQVQDGPTFYPNARWVEPRLVAQVEFRGWSADKLLRHAVFKGLDPDFGDMLDFLAADIETRAILLYVEAITAARKFMSGRSAGRSKPVRAACGKGVRGPRSSPERGCNPLAF